MAKKQIQKKPTKKKKWFPLITKGLFEGKSLGESYVYEAADLEGKHLSFNLMNLLGDMKKQAAYAEFKVTEVKDSTGYAEIIGMKLMPAAMKRIVRRNREKIADSFLTRSKDGKIFRIKPVIVTRNNTHNSVKTRLRLELREQIRNYAAKKDYVYILKDVIGYDLQRSFSRVLSKITPVRTLEIRYVKLEDAKVKVKDRSAQEEPATVNKETAEEVKEKITDNKEEETKEVTVEEKETKEPSTEETQTEEAVEEATEEQAEETEEKAEKEKKTATKEKKKTKTATKTKKTAKTKKKAAKKKE